VGGLTRRERERAPRSDAVISDFKAETLKGFVADNTVDGSTILTDGSSSYQGMKGRKHVPKTVGVMAAHELLPWVHRVFSNLKRLGLGVYYGFRRAHFQAYLDEFVFRWNRRRHYRSRSTCYWGSG
jgi:transposase-like protein